MSRSRRVAAGLVLLLCGCTATSSPASPTETPTEADETADASPSTPPGESTAPSTGAEVSPPPATVFAEGVISTEAEEWRISFTPDGATAFFARSDGFFPQTRDATIMETTLADGSWSEPVVASFSGEFADIDPWVSPDGDSIYFSSIRPLEGATRRDAELYRVDREGDGWSEPVHLAALGSDLDELGLSIAEDGTAIFASDRPGGSGGWDLYVAAADGDTFTEPEPIAELNSPIWEFNPALDAAGTTLVFTAINRPGGVGLGDLWAARRNGDAWSEPQPLPLNTLADEYHPSLSPDGSTLYFVRRTAHGDLFELDWPEIDPTD